MCGVLFSSIFCVQELCYQVCPGELGIPRCGALVDWMRPHVEAVWMRALRAHCTRTCHPDLSRAASIDLWHDHGYAQEGIYMGRSPLLLSVPP